MLWSKVVSSLPVLLEQNSSYLPVSEENLQTGGIKGIQCLSFLCLTLKCQKVFLFPEGLERRINKSTDTQAPEALEVRSCRTPPFALRHCLSRRF